MDNRIWITSEAKTAAKRYDLLTKVRDLDASDELGQYLIRASRAALPEKYRKDEEVLAEIKRVYFPEHICAVDVINDLERMVSNVTPQRGITSNTAKGSIAFEKRKSRLLMEEHRFDARAQAAYEAAGLPAEFYLGKAACLPAHRFLYLMEAAKNYFLRKEMDKKTIETMIHNTAVVQMQLAAAAKLCGVAVEALAAAVIKAFEEGEGRIVTIDGHGAAAATTPRAVIFENGFFLFSGDGKGVATNFIFSECEAFSYAMEGSSAPGMPVLPGGGQSWEEEVQL